jgi:hypothetical protein
MMEGVKVRVKNLAGWITTISCKALWNNNGGSVTGMVLNMNQVTGIISCLIPATSTSTGLIFYRKFKYFRV